MTRPKSIVRPYMWLVWALFGQLLFGSLAAAESLYTEADFQPLAADRRAHGVGDTVTVLVVEASKAQSSSDAKAKQALDASASLTQTHDQETGALQLGLGRNSNAETARQGQLQASISVSVKNVDAHGRLFVSGEQEITINGEKQRIDVSGWMRPEDISGQNTILSTRLSDAKIEYDGQGFVGDTNKSGFIYWLFTKIGLI